MHKGYSHHATTLHPDPARAAEELNLRGVHTPTARELIGAWRWPAMYDNRATFVPMAQAGYVVDLGGSAGPVGYGTVVVDYESPDRKALWDLPGRPSGVFCVHTLEHVEDPALLLVTIAAKLAPGGFLVVVVPSWRNVQLHHRLWPYHRHTFALAGEEDAPPDVTDLDALLGSVFPHVHEIQYAENHNLVAVVSTAPPPEVERTTAGEALG